MTRCVECDKSFEGDFDKHCETDEHILNYKVNRIVRLMDDMELDLATLTKVLKSRGKDSTHGRFVL